MTSDVVVALSIASNNTICCDWLRNSKMLVRCIGSIYRSRDPKTESNSIINYVFYTCCLVMGTLRCSRCREIIKNIWILYGWLVAVRDSWNETRPIIFFFLLLFLSKYNPWNHLWISKSHTCWKFSRASAATWLPFDSQRRRDADMKIRRMPISSQNWHMSDIYFYARQILSIISTATLYTSFFHFPFQVDGKEEEKTNDGWVRYLVGLKMVSLLFDWHYYEMEKSCFFFFHFFKLRHVSVEI